MQSDAQHRLDPFVAAVDAIGDSWTFLITREAFFGAQRFDQFSSKLNISKSRLSERLKHLVATEIFGRSQYETAPPRFEYLLTPKGRAIYPIALTMIDWGKKWGKAKSDVELIHTPCGHPLRPISACRACGEEVAPQDIVWPPIIPLDQAILDTANVRGWRKMSDISGVSQRKDPAIKALSAAGDRWSMLIMYGAQQRDFRFREARAKLGIADNILSSRLHDLVANGLLERTDVSKQAAYRATEAGLGMLQTVLATRTWAEDQLVEGQDQWNAMTHKSCGATLRTDITCAHCGEVVEPQHIVVRPNLRLVPINE